MTPSKTIKITADPSLKPKAASSLGATAPPPSQKNLFGSGAQDSLEPPAVPSLLQMTETPDLPSTDD
jgi:hypothetical protein